MSEQQQMDTAVRLEVYRFFMDEGRAPVAAEVAGELEMDVPSVEESFGRLADAHVLVLAPGTPYIWMANPFSALPTPFTVEVSGRTWFGNCIWDAMGAVVMLGGTGTVRTWCPDCGEGLYVSLEGDWVTSGEGIVHFAVPAAHWWDDIGFN
jgi:Alkylmercury lyase